jgi:fumarylacetoacetase
MSHDDTIDPGLLSWVESANDADTDFPIQNLPYGRLRRKGTAEPWRIGVAIGHQVLDLSLALDAAPWSDGLGAPLRELADGDLNAFMARPASERAALRQRLSQGLRRGSAHESALRECLVAQADIELDLPCRIGDYTDFYTGIHHATTVGKLFRPDAPLMPNYKWVPIGYHGRASSIGVSGQHFHRPKGQTKAADASEPSFGPSRRIDYELELGIFIGTPNELGSPVPMADAESHVFGLALFNDWSARDIQAWEYQPLGPFLAKNFASTVSPWVVTMEALAPFRRPFERPAGDPQPLPYLDSPTNRAAGAFDIQLEVWLQTQAMRDAGLPPQRLSHSNFLDAYWTIAQLVAHHTVNGCNLQSGDLLGTGTLSGPTAAGAASLLELTQGGRQPITLPNGETRTFLEDGDTIILRGFCEQPGARRIGFGECAGTLLRTR